MSTALAELAQAPARPIASAADAEQLIKHLIDVMDALLGIVEEETELVRAGKLRDAQKLEPDKTELSRMYVTDTSRIKASQGYLKQSMPKLLDDLRERHETFRALLQMNLTVLATAHAVSESIMRSVSTELARKATPQGYGASGKAATPSAGSRQPLTLSRVL
jgi:hypothetical protein